MAGIGETFADVLAGGIEVAHCGFCFVVAEEFREHFQLDGDADIALGERVMNFSGDAGALGEDGAEFQLGAEEAEAECKEDQSRGECEEEQVKPDGLVEVGA